MAENDEAGMNPKEIEPEIRALETLGVKTHEASVVAALPSERQSIRELSALIRLFYNHEAAKELELMAQSDIEGARELAAAALHPAALAMKHRIDADERKIQSG